MGTSRMQVRFRSLTPEPQTSSQNVHGVQGDQSPVAVG